MNILSQLQKPVIQPYSGDVAQVTKMHIATFLGGFCCAYLLVSLYINRPSLICRDKQIYVRKGTFRNQRHGDDVDELVLENDFYIGGTQNITEKLGQRSTTFAATLDDDLVFITTDTDSVYLYAPSVLTFGSHIPSRDMIVAARKAPEGKPGHKLGLWSPTQYLARV